MPLLRPRHAMCRALQVPQWAPVGFPEPCPAVLTSPTDLANACLLQYNVTVAGIVQSGQKRQGLNMRQLTTAVDRGLRMLDITATSSSTATAKAAPGAGANFVAYIFIIRRVDCPTCPPITVRSGPSGTVDISGLEPGVKVCVRCSGGQTEVLGVNQPPT